MDYQHVYNRRGELIHLIDAYCGCERCKEGREDLEDNPPLHLEKAPVISMTDPEAKEYSNKGNLYRAILWAIEDTVKNFKNDGQRDEVINRLEEAAGVVSDLKDREPFDD